MTLERGAVWVRLDSESERIGTPLFDDTVVEFGRSGTCPIRLGHLPVEDDGVPGCVGQFEVANGRVGVRLDGNGPRPVLVKTSIGEQHFLPGWFVSPPDERFTIVVSGRRREWEIDIVTLSGDVRVAERRPSEVPTYRPRPDLTDDEWEALEAYAEPVLAGRRLPATHKDVAAKIYRSYPTTRRLSESIHDKFFGLGMYLPAVNDTPTKIVESAIAHRLVPRHRPEPEQVVLSS